MSPNATRLKEAGVLDPTKLSKEETKLLEGLSEAEIASLIDARAKLGPDEKLPFNFVI